MPVGANLFETKPITEVLSELEVQVEKGLSDEEVKQRQTTYSFNEVVEKITIECRLRNLSSF